MRKRPIAEGSKSSRTVSLDFHRSYWMPGTLLAILLLAAILRLAKLDEIPPGLHVDEAATAWNAYTLLKTGKDQHGVSWPIFYTRAFGGNPSLMYIYALLPFQAMGGLNVWTTRLPAAIGGVITVLLIFIVGKRLFEPWTGLMAAGLLAVNPWHLQRSRILAEATLVPLCIMISVAALLWAKLPLDDGEEHPRPIVAALAGCILGISCYGYWALRLFLPIFLVGIILVTWRAWRDCLKTPEGISAVCAMVLAGIMTVSPLVWKHLTDPEIGKRGQIASWVWSETDTLGEKIVKVASRYPGHFGPDFLFISGDRDPALSPPLGTGLFHWYELPLMVMGLVACAGRFKSSRSARVLLVWILLYPVSDLLNAHISLHSMRSLPGLCGLILLEAVGAVSAFRWLREHHHRAVPAICGGVVLLVLILDFRYFYKFFVDYPRQKYAVLAYGADVLQAAQWLRPRLKDVDAVFVTGFSVHPYITTLVGLDYDPQQWFRDTREIMPGPLPGGAYKYEDVYLRYGKMHFMFGDSSVAALEKLLHNGKPDRVVFIVRPGELGLHRHARPVHEIRNPEGRAVLWIFDQAL